MSQVPSLLFYGILYAAPQPFVQRTVDFMVGKMRKEHPKLFKNLARLPSAIVLIEPSDIPHRFKLSYGKKGVFLSVALSDEDVEPDAHIKGSLEGLLNLLEGRADGDKLFFSRNLEISGDTAVIVALRNTLDREEIDLLEDMTAPLGPFARPAKIATLLLDKAARHASNRLAAIGEKRAKALAKDAARAECEKLRAEIQGLKARLTQVEAQRKKAR